MLIKRSRKEKRKLEIELIPRDSWYNNIRTKEPKLWNAFKKKAKDITHCEICNVAFEGRSWKRHDIHEVFSYNEKTKVQKLIRFEHLCNACHMAKHPGFMGLDTSEKGRKRQRYVIDHVKKVNNMTEEEYDNELRTAVAIWEDRSKIKWTVDFKEQLEELKKL